MSSQYLYTISLTLKGAVTAAKLLNLELDSLLSRFYGSAHTKKSMNWVCKTNIDCSFILGMVENYCTLDKIQPLPTIHLGPTGLGE